MFFFVQTVEIRLMESTNGARIDSFSNIYKLTILANDNPHGAVEFVKPSYIVPELKSGKPQNIELKRV